MRCDAGRRGDVRVGGFESRRAQEFWSQQGILTSELRHTLWGLRCSVGGSLERGVPLMKSADSPAYAGTAWSCNALTVDMLHTRYNRLIGVWCTQRTENRDTIRSGSNWNCYRRSCSTQQAKNRTTMKSHQKCEKFLKKSLGFSA